MKTLTLFALALLPVALDAACKDGTVTNCSKNGKKGTRECVNGRFTPCLVEPDPEPRATGEARPRYMVLQVIYAPPGTTGSSASSVVYGSESTAGTSVSSGSSFKSSHKVTVSASVGVLGGSAGASASYGYARNSSNDTLLDIKKTTTNEIAVRGPGADGIDHDRDQIWLWLSPRLRVSFTKTAAAWTVVPNQTMELLFVFTGHLKNPSQMPAGVKQRLADHKITEADFPKILAANPFANGAAAIDPLRFQLLPTTFPYSPPFTQGDPVTTLKTTISEAITQTNTSSVQTEHTVGMSLSFETPNVPLLAKASLKQESSWTWTQKSTKSASSTNKESASVTIGGPSFGFQGPASIAVYYDVLYKTFLFAPLTGAVDFRGRLTSRGGKPAAGVEVMVSAGGKTHRTFTNARGEYEVPGRWPGNVEIRAGGQTKRAVSGPGGRDLVLP